MVILFTTIFLICSVILAIYFSMYRRDTQKAQRKHLIIISDRLDKFLRVNMVLAIVVALSQAIVILSFI